MLKKVKDEVEKILIKYPWTRDSDNELYKVMLIERGLHEVPIGHFLSNIKNFNMPTIESVGRVRRKIQEKNPELRPKEKVQEYKHELEQEYIDFARS